MALSLSCRGLLNAKQFKFIQLRRNGFIVLLPEVPRDNPEDNSLLRNDPIQDFSLLTPEKCFNGLRKRCLNFDAAFWNIEREVKEKKQRLTATDLFDEYLDPIEKHLRLLESSKAVVRVLHCTQGILSFENYLKVQTRANQSRHGLFSSPLLINCCQEVLLKYKDNLTEEQVRLLSKFVLEGNLHGVTLSDKDSDSLQSVRKNIHKATSLFVYKFQIASRLHSKRISDHDMAKNFPLDLLAATSDSGDPAQGPWTFTLEPHIVDQFLEYCPDSLSRMNMWKASVSCCDDENEHEGVNSSADIEEIRSLRKEQANILGYKTYADLSMETKMAGSVENVQSMLELLLEKARPAQAREVESLNKFALQNGFHKTLDIWDVPYWKRRQQSSSYNLNEDNLRAYFPLDTVLSGLFGLARDLFGILIQKRSGVDIWHKDVQCFDVFEAGSNVPIANIYLDPYARPEKINHTNHSSYNIILRHRSTIGSLQTPQVAMIFNFSSPTLGKPSLLTLKNVSDLFEKFGSALQHLLCKTNYSELSGLSNVEWDAVEVSGNLMIHWLYTPEVMRSISNHFESGERVPTEVIDSLNRVRKHMAGYTLCRDIYFSRFDLEMYKSRVFWRSVMRKLWPMHFVFPLDKDDSHPCSFLPIFAEEWGAAYFCHLWSRVLAADIFSAFEEVGLENRENIALVGKRYRDTYLALGGACHSAEVFRRFRGRDPSPDAMMLWLGLQKHQSPKTSKTTLPE